MEKNKASAVVFCGGFILNEKGKDGYFIVERIKCEIRAN